MYEHVSREEVVDRIKHIRNLHRQVAPTTAAEQEIYNYREQKTGNLLSNLRRLSNRPMLSLVHDFGMRNSLTADGAHRLFGYILDSLRDHDSALNGGRTHIDEARLDHLNMCSLARC